MKLYLPLLILAASAFAQLPTQVSILGPAPNGITFGGASPVNPVSGGGTPIYYYVVTRYPSGLAYPGFTITAFNTPGIQNLSSQNYVNVSWSSMPGATGYDVLRSAVPRTPSAPCTGCAVVLNTPSVSVHDTGQNGGNYPPAGINAVQDVTGQFQIDNISSATPFLTWLLLGKRLPVALGSGGGATIPNTTNALKGDGAGNAAAVTGNAGDCVHVDGSSSSCGTGSGTPASSITTSISGGVTTFTAVANTAQNFLVSVTATITSGSFANLQPGEDVSITWTQDGVGHPVTAPSGMTGSCLIDTNANHWTTLRGYALTSTTVQVSSCGGSAFGIYIPEGTGTATTGSLVIMEDSGTHTPQLSANGGSFTPIISGTQYRIVTCQPGLGDGLNAIPAGTYLQSTCLNEFGVTWTITGIKCFTNNNGGSTLNVTNSAGASLLTGVITCTNAYAAGTQSATVTLPAADFAKFIFVSDGSPLQTSWVITGTR